MITREITNRPNERPLALVLDDDDDEKDANRYQLRAWLEQAGHDVIAVSTGAEALAVLQTTVPDLAVLDVKPPNMTGYEVCEAIRSNPPTAWTPVIHVSASSIGPSDRFEGLLRGADAFLVQPIERSDFIGVVTALARRSAGRRRVATSVDRLRELTAATADVHGASQDGALFAALVAGAARIAGAPATLVMRTGDGDTLRTHPVTDTRAVASAALDELLGPARAGVTTLFTDDPRVVDRQHAGVAFVDETGEPIGALLVPSDLDGTDEVLSLLAQLSISTSLALANIRALSVEHRIALILQDSLLPKQPPTIDGLAIAFRYVAASTQAQVGGDFYEAFELDEHTAAIAIGDVVGHSLRAATVMGELRYALRCYAIDGYGPREVVSRLERLLQRFHPGMFTSMVYGTVDITTGVVELCNAGHLPTVLISGGAARLVHGAGALVGIGAPTAPLTTLQMARGDRLLMVTDGLIERRRENIDDGIERLRLAGVAMAGDHLEAMVDRLLIEIGPGGAPDDDIAILAVELRR